MNLRAQRHRQRVSRMFLTDTFRENCGLADGVQHADDLASAMASDSLETLPS